MPSAVPVLGFFRVHQADVRLVDQCQELLGGREIALLDGGQRLQGSTKHQNDAYLLTVVVLPSSLQT